ncbi:19759_t:CDS:2, partial [Gigaspora margarita]
NLKLSYMSKTHEYNIQLVATGVLEPELHYGIYARHWWTSRPSEKNQNTEKSLILIRLGQKKLSSEISISSTTAILSLYQQFFNKDTKFSEPLLLGWDDNEIIKELSSNIFFPFTISYNKLSIFIHGIGVSNKLELKNAGNGYHATILHFYKKSNDSNVLHKYDGMTLFGINSSKTQQQIEDLKRLTCTTNKWNNQDQMNKLYNYYIKHHIKSSNIDWYKFFSTWIEKKNTIIELYSELLKIYSLNYKLKNEEIEFWSNSSNFDNDKINLEYLYKLGLLRVVPEFLINITKTFWNCFRCSLEENIRGLDGKQRILSIIADSFPYNILEDQLKISPSFISAAKIYGQINASTSQWNIPIYRTIASTYDEWDPQRWPVEKIKKQLDNLNIVYENNMKKNELLDKLQENFIKNMMNILNNENKNENKNENDITQIDLMQNSSFIPKFFLLKKGWALKENQQFGKKGKGKRMTLAVLITLKRLFIAGQANASQKYSAQDMLDELNQMAKNNLLELEEIPSVKTIQSWISRYSKEIK